MGQPAMLPFFISTKNVKIGNLGVLGNMDSSGC